MSFTNLGLSNLLSQTITSLYDTPTTLQEQAIPIILKNDDLMVATQTGTGKIGSFALPIIEKLFPNGMTDRQPLIPKQTRTLILVATQDEAVQVTDYFKAYSFDFPLNIACVLDNVSITPQTKILGRGVDVLIATPTRLSELLTLGAVDLSAVEVLVLDEAELVTSDSLIKTTKEIIHTLPTQRQTLLFASHFSDDVLVSAHFFLNNPETLEITVTPQIEHIKQSIFSIPNRQKAALLTHLINKYSWPQLLVFTRTKYGATRLANHLARKEISAGMIYPNAKNNALEDFKNGLIQVLIVTDIPSDSLGIKQLPCLINFDLPYIENDYALRISAFDQIGEALSFVSPEEEKLLLVIESHINQKINDGDTKDFIFDETEQEIDSDRFKRIYRHPAVGRKSRQRKAVPDIVETEETTTQQEDLLEKSPKPHSKSLYNRNKTKKTRNIYNKHRRNIPSAPLENPPIDRPEDEFRDDDYDNFGNSVDYVSPYQSKKGNKRPQTSFTKDTVPAPSTTNRYKPRTNRTNAGTQQPTTRRPRNSLYRRNNNRPINGYQDDRLTATPSFNESELQVPKKSTSTPAIIHRKHSRVDRLPTIEQLDNMPNRHIVRGEKPALLTRQHHDDE